MTTLPPEAIKILELVKVHMRAEPRRLNMKDWILRRYSCTPDVTQFVSSGALPSGFEFPPCGTVGCIAGWICILSGKDESLLNTISAPYRANEAMFLPTYSALTDKLFYLDYWPLNYRLDYEQAETPEERVEATCARIDYFIENDR